MGNEDAQPNEVRLGRKGLSLVPAIRSTRPVPSYNARFSYAGPERHYHPYSSSSSHHRGLPSRQGRPPASQGSTSNSYQSLSVQQRVAISDREHRPWRNRPPEAGPSEGSVQSRHSHPEQGNKHSSPNRKTALPIDSAVLELPTSCRKGSPNRKINCQRWIREQITQLEANLGVKVISHAFISENKVRLEYRVDQDKKLGAPAVNLPAGNGGSILPVSIPATAAAHQDVTNRMRCSIDSLTGIGSQQTDPGGPSAFCSSTSSATDDKFTGRAKTVKFITRQHGTVLSLLRSRNAYRYLTNTLVLQRTNQSRSLCPRMVRLVVS